MAKESINKILRFSIWLIPVAILLLFLSGWYLHQCGVVLFYIKNGCLTIGHKTSDPNIYDITFNSDSFRKEHGLTCGGRLIERPDSIDLTLRVPFEVLGKSKLVIAVPNESNVGLPVEAFRKLILLPPLKFKAIQFLGINDLNGKVRIRTPEGALAFCRLLTSPVTCYYLDGPGVEVASKDQVDTNFCFGDKETLSYYRNKKCSGSMGVVESKSDLNYLGIRPAVVKKTPGGYEIRRTLLVEKDTWYNNYFVDVVETVGTYGSYSRKTIRERRVPASKKYFFCIGHPI